MQRLRSLEQKLTLSDYWLVAVYFRTAEKPRKSSEEAKIINLPKEVYLWCSFR